MGFLTRFLSRLTLRIIGFIAAIAIALGVGVTLFALTLMPDLPSIESLDDIELKVPLRVYSAKGDLLAEYGDERRVPVTVDQVPRDVVNAILAAEDDGFYEHPGIDIKGVVRAALANVKQGGSAQGASTITMQVARNYFLTREKTYTRKLREVLLSLRLERALSKDQILELYMNKIFLGHRAYGFAAAAGVYYDRGLQELDLSQIAMLAGLPKAPSRTNPISNPKRAVARRNYVLDRMHSKGWINDEQYQIAREKPVSAKKYVAKVDVDSPYVAEMVRQYMIEKYGENVYESGYNVYTTIVPEYQRAADAAVRKGVIAYEKRHGWRGPAGTVDLAVIDDQYELSKALSEHPTSHEVVPGVVVRVDGSNAHVMLESLDEIAVPFEGMKWARKFKNTRLRGPAPKKPSDVLEVGMIVYVIPTVKGSWELTQLPEASSALVSIDPNNGAIKAISGGFDYYLSKFNRATQAERQPGSNIKPFIYAAAIDKGFTPASLVSGAPIVIEDSEVEQVWRPENYSGKFFGPTRIRKALSLSLNLVSVRLLRAIGPGYARTYLERFGFDRDKLPKGLALSLGSASVTPLELATAYTVLANGGYRVEPYFISRIEDRAGQVIEEFSPLTVCSTCPDPDPATLAVGDDENLQQPGAAPASADDGKPRVAPRVLDRKTAFLMQSLLQQVVKSGTAQKAKALGRSDLAGKTGTTNNFVDAWFSGFTPQLHTTVWFGFDQPGDLGKSESGSRAALPVWIDYMKVALKDYPEKSQPIPDGIVTAYVDKDSGEATSPSNPNGYKEYFAAGTEPTYAGGFTSGPSAPTVSGGVSTINGRVINPQPGAAGQPGAVSTPDLPATGTNQGGSEQLF